MTYKEVRAITDGLKHVRGDQANDEIAHPSRRSGNRHGLTPVAQIKNLGWQYPANGSKREAEEDIVDVDECDARSTRNLGCFEIRKSGNDTANDHKRDKSTNGAGHE